MPLSSALLLSVSICFTSRSVVSWHIASPITPRKQRYRHTRHTSDLTSTTTCRTDQERLLRQSFDNNDAEARSQFGTKEYWDSMYEGYGDFPRDEYSWYFGFDAIKSLFTSHVPNKASKVLVPGVGNDPMLLDLVGAGYMDITAFDYSESAIERQEELLSYDSAASERVDLYTMDARALEGPWTDAFDAILEKGALDALYLSGDGNVEKAADELRRVLRAGGIFVSVSGVVPEELRREIFPTEDWEWLRDGSDDLKAGCFVWKKR